MTVTFTGIVTASLASLSPSLASPSRRWPGPGPGPARPDLGMARPLPLGLRTVTVQRFRVLGPFTVELESVNLAGQPRFNLASSGSAGRCGAAGCGSRRVPQGLSGAAGRDSDASGFPNSDFLAG